MDKTLTREGDLIPLFKHDDDFIPVNTTQWFDELSFIQEETDKQYKEIYDVCKPDCQVTKRSCSTRNYFSWFKRAS